MKGKRKAGESEGHDQEGQEQQQRGRAGCVTKAPFYHDTCAEKCGSGVRFREARSVSSWCHCKPAVLLQVAVCSVWPQATRSVHFYPQKTRAASSARAVGAARRRGDDGLLGKLQELERYRQGLVRFEKTMGDMAEVRHHPHV